MLKCRTAVALTHAEEDRVLSVGERVSLALHRFFCPPCRMYRRQLAVMKAALDRLKAGDAAAPAMPDDLRARLRQRLEDARQARGK